MIICKNCGNQLPDGENFCSECGASLHDESTDMNGIIVSAKNGDPEAFGKLYESCRKAGISLAKQYVKNDTDAEDMYQDAFLKAMENIDRFDENRQFGPWLNTIIANTCKDFLGKKRPMNFTDMSDEENEFVDTIASTDESSLPESMYVRKEMLQIIDGIVEMLPDEQKEATLLFYYKDYSVKQVAEYQHVSEDTVKSRLNYSRKKVEQATKDYEKKHGIKICAYSVIPAILVLYFKNSVYASQLDASLGALSASNGLSGAGAAAKTGSGSIKAGTAAKAGAAVKTAAAAGKAAAWKIVAAAVTGIIAATGVGFAIHHFVTSVDLDEIVDEDSIDTSEDSDLQEDTDDQVADTQEESAAEELSSIEEKTATGYINEEGYYVFGSYEQDGDESNGPEPIEWLILDENENGTLLISRYVLDCVKYGESEETWENCSLRSWLNNDFINNAFTAEEQAFIPTVNLVNSDNAFSGTPGGDNTNDRIFCLSTDEVLKYFSFDSYYEDDYYGYSQTLITPPTDCVLNKHVTRCTITQDVYNNRLKDIGYTTDCIGQTGAKWWLRSPSFLYHDACIVGGDGRVDAKGNCAKFSTTIGVRPALYISENAAEEVSSLEEITANGYINGEGYYVFGSYEQDGDLSNGPEPIEWLILDENGNGTLLISRYVLDCVQYNTIDTEVTWETCTLRSWMNNDFYNAAFDDGEKASINTTYAGCNDRIFALNVYEERKYFGNYDPWYAQTPFSGDQSPIAPPTQYAESRGVCTLTITNDDYWKSGEEYSANWWLRSMGNHYGESDDVACIFSSDHGQAGTPISVVRGDIGVRPVMWVNL